MSERLKSVCRCCVFLSDKIIHSFHHTPLSKVIACLLYLYGRKYCVVCSDLKVNTKPVHVCVYGVLREDQRIPIHYVSKCFSRDSDNTRDVFQWLLYFSQMRYPLRLQLTFWRGFATVSEGKMEFGLHFTVFCIILTLNVGEYWLHVILATGVGEFSVC